MFFVVGHFSVISICFVDLSKISNKVDKTNDVGSCDTNGFVLWTMQLLSTNPRTPAQPLAIVSPKIVHFMNMS